MLIALLAVLGVDLIVLVAVVAFLLSRKRWVKGRDGAFPGAIRVSDGEVDGFGPKWRRGYGRWVGEVLVWTKGPFLLRNELVPAEGADGPRPAHPDEVSRLGDHPSVVRVRTGDAVVDVAARGEAGDLLLGPYGKPVATLSTATVVSSTRDRI